MKTVLLLGGFLVTAVLPGLLAPLLAAETLRTAFTYQGRLADNDQPASGQYDLHFGIFDRAIDGVALATKQIAPVTVRNGLFAVTMDWENGDLFNGDPRWLEIQARTNGSALGYITLTPRQLMTATPYAILAATASTVPATGIIGGTIADARLSTNVALLNGNAGFLGTISAAAFHGSGVGLSNVAGTFSWQVVSDLARQASPDSGYLAANHDRVTITLPPSAPVGAVVRVAGLGAGGWRIAQNTGQNILTRPLGGPAGLNWVASEGSPTFYWQSVACSADGKRVLAAQSGGQLLTSTDGGATWTAHESDRSWRAVASSADGSRLVAAERGGFIYTSDDVGLTWTARLADAERTWNSVASSADGDKLAAAVSGGQIYTSTNGGVSWTACQADRTWNSVASSADGNKLVAADYNGYLHTSADGGRSWTEHDSPRGWRSVASSADGTRLLAAVSGGYLYTSADSGVTWVEHAIGGGWESVASSADGMRLVAVPEPGPAYFSTNAGLTWIAGNVTEEWESVASSADGTRLVAVVGGGRVYTSIPSTTSGEAGALTGGTDEAVELQYVGNDQFRILSFVGTVSAE